MKIRIKEVPGKISFTLDGWTSRSVLPFVAIRVHYINAEWKYESVLLDFVEIDGHSGSDLKDVFLDCLKRYEIPLSNVMPITMDNVDSNSTFMDELEKHGIEINTIISSTGNRVRCLAHVLNLAVQDTMNSLKISLTPNDYEPEDEEDFSDEEGEELDEDIDVMSAEDEFDNEDDQVVSNMPTILKLRKLVRKIRKSTIKRKQLRKMCQLCRVEYFTPKIDVKTRWNSTYEMLERARYLKKPLLALCSSQKSLTGLSINEVEWTELKKLCTLLQKFDRSTKLVSMERHPTISAYIPTLNWLLDSLKSFIKENPGALASAAKIGLEKLEKYEDLLDIQHSKLPYVGVFMNPALKMSYFREHKYRNIKEIQKQISDIFERDYETAGENTDNNEQEDSEDEFYAHMFKRAKVSKASREIQKYLQFPLPSKKADILEFWRSQETEFPSLTKMARDVLPIQPSSVAVERDFSSASDTVSSNQCSLKAGTIRARMCLKMWYKDQLNQYSTANSNNKTTPNPTF